MLGRSLISLTSMIFLFLASFVLFLLFFVFELAEIEDFADRRVGIGRDLDQIEAGIGSHGERFVAPDDPHHIALDRRRGGRAGRRSLR